MRDIKGNNEILKSVLRSGLLVIFCSCVIDARASEFLLESEINARVTYDDNVNISGIDKESASIFMIQPKVKLTQESDNWETTVNAHVAGTTYSSQLQDQIDSHLDFGTAYKKERSIYSIFAGYDNRSNRAEETDIFGLTPDQVDTKTITVAPKYTHLFTERLSLSAAYSFSNVDYDPNAQGQFLPYELQTVTGAAAYKLSQITELNLTLAATDYEADNKSSEFQVLSSMVGVTHSFSRMISGQISAGVNDRDFTNRTFQNFNFANTIVTGTQEVKSSDTGSLYDASIDAGWITLGVRRDTVPNSSGGLNQTDRVNAKLRMQLTPLIGITLRLLRDEIEEINESIQDDSRVNTVITPTMKFTFARNLTVWASYVHGELEYKDSARDTSDYNRFYVSMKYNFPSI